MLRPQLLPISILLLSFLRPVHSEDTSCEAAARQLGQPVDGWKLVKHYDENEGGNIRARVRESCVREPTSLECEPQETLYYNAESRTAGCCQHDGSVTWQDEEAKLGWCCAVGHEWSGDIPTGEGGCCPTGYVMVDGQCVEKQASSSCGCHSKAKGEAGGDAADNDGETEKAQETRVEKEGDEAGDLEAVETSLSLSYGTCYELATSDGRPIGSNRENAIYTPNGLFQGIPFRVCRSTEDCAAKGHDDGVTSSTPFYLQDQMGRFNDPNGTKGWVSYITRGVLKIKFSTDGRDAEELFASKGKSCGEEECFKLSDVGLELVFKETDCAPWTYEDPEPKSDQFRIQHDSSEL